MTLDSYIGRKPRSERLADIVERVFGVRLNELQTRAIEVIENTDDNILVTAPTGSGKTLIGYAALLKEQRGFYLAPLIAIMVEKWIELTRYVKRFGFTVSMTNRDYRIPVSKLLSANFKIMSPYKFISLINYIDPDKHGRVLVIDEIHRMSEDPMFEAAVTLARERGFRIIGLSATIGEKDLDELTEWLDAVHVSGDVRPVPLYHKSIEFRWYGRLVAQKEVTVKGNTVVGDGEVFASREEAAATIAARIYYYTGRPVIVWAPTRSRVEIIARIAANMLPESPRHEEVARKLPASNPTERLLRFTVRRGVFIHHGGLSFNARSIVEEAYKRLGGVLVTAYTLSHGVNLPGTFLVISTIYDYKGEPLDATMFHQISGRAGRPGLDEYGVVVTILVDDAEYAYYDNVLLAKTAGEIKPVLLDDTFTAVKMALPVYMKSGIEGAKRLLLSSYSYKKKPRPDRVNAIIEDLEGVVNFYNRVGGAEALVAMEMGIHPLEYNLIRTALRGAYYEVLPDIIEIASRIADTDPQRVREDIVEYGYLAIWLGRKPEARMVAEIIQSTLETGAHWAARVYGWKSSEHVHLIGIAKQFAFAGNPRVEPLAREVRIDTLRRMIKAAPQIVKGATGEEAISAAVVALKEAFAFRKRVARDRLKRLASLVLYAITGEEPGRHAVEEIVGAVMHALREQGVEVI